MVISLYLHIFAIGLMSLLVFFFILGDKEGHSEYPVRQEVQTGPVEVGEAPLGPGPGEAFLRRVFQLNEAM
mgnify:CR=1 FL=1